MDGEGRPLRSKRQVNFCHLWRLGLKSHVSMSRTPLLAGLGICGTRFCLSQAQMSKPQGTWVRSPWILGSAGRDKGWEPCLPPLEPGVDRPSTLLVLLLPSCFCQGSPSCCGATCYCPEKKEVKEGLKFSSKPNT